MRSQFNVKELLDIVNGIYYGDQLTNHVISDFEFSPYEVKKKEHPSQLCFISISNERWNNVHRRQTNWQDGNEAILPFASNCALIITESPIQSLKNIVPQIIVDNSFTCMPLIAEAAREKMTHPVIAITGSVGKSSTRLVIEHFVKDTLDYVATRGNHNTQSGVPLYGSKLCTNPDLGILEVSLNALNNRGNQSLTIQPDVAIVTSIGEAHLSTLHTTENIARFKARLFTGLKENGLVIINKDIHKRERHILIEAARKRTNRIKFFSMTNVDADMYVKEIQHEKYHSTITICYAQKEYTFKMQLPSEGMIMNVLAALLTLAELGHDIRLYLANTYSFRSLDKIMQLKQLKTADHRQIDLIDDSHNAAIPSMINAIETFKQKTKFYPGYKILILGQVADLGKNSKALHDRLVPYIKSSGADYVFGHGHYMRDVIRQLPAKMVGGWFTNAKDLASFVPLYCQHESLLLLKGSVSGSDFHTLSLLLPRQIQQSQKMIHQPTPRQIASYIQPVLGAASVDEQTGEILETYGYRHSKSIEGLGPVLLLYLLLRKGVDDQGLTRLHRWPTNRGVTNRGKPYKTDLYYSHKELMEELMYTQHPSAIFELAQLYFGSRADAMRKITQLVEAENISETAALNLTGRYRVKEQQAYYLKDLCKVARLLQPYHAQLGTIYRFNRRERMKGILFGNIRQSMIGFYEDKIICATGLRRTEELKYVINETMPARQKIKI